MMYRTQDARRPRFAPEWWTGAVQVRNANAEYARNLRGIADRTIASMREILGPGPTYSDAQIARLITVIEQWVGPSGAAYKFDSVASPLDPWANAVANKMISDVTLRDMRMWLSRVKSDLISQEMYAALHTAPLQHVQSQLLLEQIALIKSIPKQTMEEMLAFMGISRNLYATAWTGERFGRLVGTAGAGMQARGGLTEQIQAQLGHLGDKARSRATLIARTETARVQTTITKARAEGVRSTHFIWRTVHDSDVRPDHRKLDGRAFEWAHPPVADERSGIRALPGCIWNCRCVAQPILPDYDNDYGSWAPSKQDQARWDAAAL